MKPIRITHALTVGAAVAIILAACQAPTVVKVATGSTQPVANDGGQSAVEKSISSDAVSSTAVPTLALSTNGLAAYQGALEQIYQQVNPSVVHIEVTANNTPGGGSGSGFVWDKQGHIITNNHVVSGMDRINVIFSDGSMSAAKIVGTDPDSDLAVLKVDVPAIQLQPVSFADSTQAKVGQFAIAIGSPFGERGSMTTGIISALGRSMPAHSSSPQSPGYSLPDMIQTDAAINPGNSGGVLVDDKGQVLGVTAAIESPVRASSGVGFVIPSVIVKNVVPALIKDGTYAHSWLGFSAGTLTPEMAAANNLKLTQRGIVVSGVTAGSPADQAGLRAGNKQTVSNMSVPVGGDVITAIDGQPVKQFEDLIIYLARNTKVGQVITLDVLRDGKTQQVKVTLAARPTSTTQAIPVTDNSPSGAQLGVTVVALTSEIARAMHLHSSSQGVLVEQVQPGSIADMVGLQGGSRSMQLGGKTIAIGGDVIVAVDGHAISQVNELQQLLADSTPGQPLSLTVLRNGTLYDIPVLLGN